jgi:hypothetical protein
MQGDDFFVDVQHRPRRVAFLLTVDGCPDTLLDEIVDFNVSSWGGRYNPVIPVTDGQITEPYWKLLNVVDPDILYAYCELSTETINRIILDIRPLDVLKHDTSRQSPHHPYGVRVRQQASSASVLGRAMDQFPIWARQPEPAAPVFEQDTQSLSPFTRRNFGANTHYYFWCRDRQIPSMKLVSNDLEVMKSTRSSHQPRSKKS